MKLHVGGPARWEGLTLFPVWTDAPEGALGYVPAPQAPHHIAVREREDGPSVEQLVVEHGLPEPLLLLGGTLLVGGWQTRTLNTSVLVAAGSEVTLPVSCVEQGRWGGGIEHEVGLRPAPPSVRRVIGRSTSAARVAAAPSRASDQGAVWSEVAESQVRLAAPSPTGSLEESARQVEGRIEEAVRALRALRALPGQRGLLVGIDGQVVALEVFDRHEALLAWWDGLVGAAAMDALGLPAQATSSSAARRFARQATALPLKTAAGIGLNTEVAAAGADLVVEGTRLHDRLLHLIAYAA